MPLLFPLVAIICIGLWLLSARWFDKIGDVAEKTVDRVKGTENKEEEKKENVNE